MSAALVSGAARSRSLQQGGAVVTQNKKGFTLIELLVVIAIIAILAAILFPVFAQAREKARQTSCGSNMKQIMTGVKMYANDFDEQSPNFWYNFADANGVFMPWMEMINPYVKNTDLFFCPSASKDPQTYYTAGCQGASVRSTYCYGAWIPYTYWTWFDGVTKFAGFPSPAVGFNSRVQNVCTSPWSVCRSAEFAEYPADALYLIEGFVMTFWPVAGTSFGSACVTGLSADGTNRNFYRHNGGMNIAFCDGHMKWQQSDRFLRENGSRTTGAYAGFPQSSIMRMGP
jgi:prepilin-type N-terminal cleavage/methylation domain-containing protein/prepilin-type processing-associated H-X9-DG protein